MVIPRELEHAKVKDIVKSKLSSHQIRIMGKMFSFLQVSPRKTTMLKVVMIILTCMRISILLFNGGRFGD